jgi:hypothetical protein
VGEKAEEFAAAEEARGGRLKIMKVIIALALMAQLLAGGPALVWKKALLRETHREVRPETPQSNISVPIQFYTFDVGDRVIICSQHLNPFKPHRVDVGVGADLAYARISDSQLVVQDAKGKQFKLTIEQETLK